MHSTSLPQQARWVLTHCASISPSAAQLNDATRAARPPSLAGPRRGKLLIATVQYTLCVGLCITYSVTAGQSLKGVASQECSGVDCQQVGGVRRRFMA